MSARGARSRKVQQKDIEKHEKKTTGKGKDPEAIYEQPDDASVDWRTTFDLNRPMTGVSQPMASSNISLKTSRSGGTNGSRLRLTTFPSNDLPDFRSMRPPKSSGGDSAFTSNYAFKGKDGTRFHAKGKETSAPRGRGGGVPTKRAAAPSPAPPTFRTGSSASYYSTNQKSWMNFRVWEGEKDGIRPYGGFDYDEDMQSGSVLIYFKEEQVDEDRPVPSIRAELKVLENSGSTWLSNALHYGRVDDNDVDEWALPSSPESLKSSQHSSLNYPQPGQRRMLGPTSLGRQSPPPFDIDETYTGIHSGAASRGRQFSDATLFDPSNSPPTFRRTSERNPTHKLWFTAPSTVKTVQGQRLHHVAIRNFLAMLHGKPIVGADLYEMLTTLQPEVQVMFDLDNNSHSRMTSRQRSVQMITNYLGQYGIDDVRNNIRQALGLLAWSEQDSVKWRQGYLESFVHVAGVMTPEVEELEDFKRLSVVTRRNLGLAGKTLQLRVLEAEERLAGFDFADLWEDTSKVANSPVYQSYQSFRQFLVDHYTRIYGNWPPITNKTWLDRKVVLAMQEDFGSLYDYLVNRDVMWNCREERASRKWEMAHRKNHNFEADLPELGMTDMLIMFDAKYGYTHIPHPYPLLPREVPKPTKEKKGFFDRMKKDKSKDSAQDAKAQLQLSIVFSDATNIEKLDPNFNGSTLIDKFEQFELTTDLKHTTPCEARLGCWVLLYGVLQVLSTLSVDVQGLKHTDNVRYFLCTDLKRCPEWVTNGQVQHLEANQHRSWCWQRSWDPTPTQTAPVELDASSVVVDRNDLSRQNSRDVKIIGHTHLNYGLPSPPPERSLPAPPPSFDSATLMQNDLRRLGEKIDSVSLSHNAKTMFHQEFKRRRENEKVMQSDFHDRKSPMNDPYRPRTSHNSNSKPASRPRQDSLPYFTSTRSQPRPDETGRLTQFDFGDGQQSAPFPSPPRTQMRSNITSVNSDLAAYPFIANGMAWPVPPGYEVSKREGSVLGDEHLTERDSADYHASLRRLRNEG